jgi:chromosome segregation ATPase
VLSGWWSSSEKEYNRIQEIEERISGVENTIEKIDTTIKENSKHKILLTQSIQETQDTIIRTNLEIIRIEENEDYQLKGLENVFNKNHRRKLPPN